MRRPKGKVTTTTMTDVRQLARTIRPLLTVMELEVGSC